MPCRCAERRTAIATAARSALRGDATALKLAAAFVGRTTVEDVEAMARRMVGRAKPASGIPAGTLRDRRPYGP